MGWEKGEGCFDLKISFQPYKKCKGWGKGKVVLI